jgi:DNA-directed RNA polymerase subunit M
MQFCDDCGSMMHTAERNPASDHNSPSSDNPDGERMVCSSCGTTAAKDADLAAQYTSTERQGDSGVIESDEDANFEGKPTDDDVTCDDCGNGRAWYTLKQTASADEPPTRFFKCTECGYRWREYN